MGKFPVACSAGCAGKKINELMGGQISGENEYNRIRNENDRNEPQLSLPQVVYCPSTLCRKNLIHSDLLVGMLDLPDVEVYSARTVFCRETRA